MKYFIGLGSVMWIDNEGIERFIPCYYDKETGLTWFGSEELADGNFAELDLVGDEVTEEDGQTLTEYWNKIKKLSREK